MGVRVALSLVVVFLAAAVVLLARIVMRQRRDAARGVDEALRLRTMHQDLGDRVIWRRGNGGDAGPQLSRRQLFPNAVAGLAALVLFRLAAKGVDVVGLATRASGKRRGGGLMAEGGGGQQHTDSHTDSPATHVDVTSGDGSSHVDTTRPHGDSHADSTSQPRTLVAERGGGQQHVDSHTDSPATHIDVTSGNGDHADMIRPHGDSHVDFIREPPPPPHNDHNDHNDTMTAV